MLIESDGTYTNNGSLFVRDQASEGRNLTPILSNSRINKISKINNVGAVASPRGNDRNTML